ncbi:2'-5' RNA ligase family protein [Flaviaesturariibacter amylovorans]|uniref:2'-5' RNA ligase family protein n=1 Tax=Flaviaesturariibacter amylovorans TaxID=1084520 RepID=A0ABP8GAX0_9BACT
MESPIASLPGYRIHEYRLVVPLSEALQERIGTLRERLYERHRVKAGPEAPPALALLHFHAFEKTESRLLERLQGVAMGVAPFKVELQNFSAYPSHSIYINVPTRAPFQELVKELKKLKWLMNIQGHEPHFISEPQLVLAQRLKPMPFIGMWMECEHSEFSGRFIADELLLLRRNAERGRWEELRRFELQQVGSVVKQGELFG